MVVGIVVGVVVVVVVGVVVDVDVVVDVGVFVDVQADTSVMASIMVIDRASESMVFLFICNLLFIATSLSNPLFPCPTIHPSQR